MSYPGGNARSQYQCHETGHKWASFGPQTATAMAGSGVRGEESGQEILMCVFCKRERFVKDSPPMFSERPENRGAVSRHELAVLEAKQTSDQRGQ